MASKYLPAGDPSERTRLGLSVYLAWVRLRVPVVQRNTMVVVAVVLAALSMLAVAGAVTGVAAVWAAAVCFAVIECAAMGAGTVVNVDRADEPAHRGRLGTRGGLQQASGYPLVF
ncbi:hypothetical protein [Streptomyces sp. NPDC001536]|uniref:hypothetical protein n=1 Tax=Streptomyces sp. NPDC001536 TaxID=3364583 RepID=UPI003681AC6F